MERVIRKMLILGTIYKAHYNDGPIPVHTRYLDSRSYKGFRRKSGGSGSQIYQVVS